MANLKKCRLKDPNAKLPMPDRAGRLFSSGPDGEVVDLDKPFWRNCERAGDIEICKPQNKRAPKA